MRRQTQDKNTYEPLNHQGFYSCITEGTGIFQVNPNVSHQSDTVVVQPGRSESMELAIKELQIGKRIQAELKEQGRSVVWLAKQLGVERTSLYYTFRQNSVDVELLLRISTLLGHNFLQDVADIYKAYGL